MAPKKVKTPLAEPEATEQVTESESITLKLDDPYKSLRYSPPVLNIHPPRPKARKTKVPVLKKRTSYGSDSLKVNAVVTAKVSQHSVQNPTIQTPKSVSTIDGTFSQHSIHFKDKGVPNFMILDPHAGVPPPLTPWVSPGEKPLTKPPPMMLQRRRPSGRGKRQIRRENFRKESNSLAHFEIIKHKQIMIENFLMAKLKKQRSQLLLRQYQLLPQIDPGGCEKTVIRFEKCETPPPLKTPVLSFFNYGNLETRKKTGLCLAMTRRERGHNVITEWFGTPHVTDTILKNLGLGPVGDDGVKNLENKQQPISRTGSPQKEGEEFMPLFPALAVVGMSYKDVQENLKHTRPGTGRIHSPASQGRAHTHHHRFANVKSGEHGGTTGGQLATDAAPPAEKHLPPPQQSPRDRSAVSGVSLDFGGNVLSWCSPDNEARAARKYTVEMGCTAELGQSAVSSTTMVNLGTVAISYNWVQVPHENLFQVSKARLMRFAFDCWGGVILPGETHRVPFLYKANDPGYFSEDWRLVTRPVLEAGATVILRLWGITRQQDRSRGGRDDVEKQLRTLITRNLASHRIDKIVDFLPLKEVPLRNTRFPLVHLGPDLFHLNNPFLKYHSKNVFCLSKMIEIFDSYLTSRSHRSSSARFRASGASFVIEDSSDMSLSESNLRRGDMNMRSSTVATSSNVVSGYSARDEGKERTSFNEFDDADPEDLGEEEQPAVYESDFMAADEQDTDDGFNLEKLVGTHDEKVATLTGMFRKLTNLESLQTKNRAVAKSVPMYRSESAGQSESRRPSQFPLSNSSAAVGSPRNVTPAGDESFLNVVEPNFQVDALRTRILANPRLEVQEAAFGVMYEEVSSLSFRTETARENWKQTIGFTHLCQAMDSFSDYAAALKEACCRGQLEEQLAQKRAEEEQAMLDALRDTVSVVDDDQELEAAADDKEDGEEKREEEKNQNNSPEPGEKMDLASASAVKTNQSRISKMAVKSNHGVLQASNTAFEWPNQADDFISACLTLNPREMFTPTRYQDQYYSRLHTRMYELLSDFVDTMDKVWTSETILKMDYDELGFTRVKDIPYGLDIEDYLTVPLPPTWIKLAQKLDAIAAENKAKARQIYANSSLMAIQ